jgi:hypothetical protein
MLSSPPRLIWFLGLFFCVKAQAWSGAGNPFCNSLPRLNWLSAPEIEDALRAKGLRLLRLRMADDKCYAVRVEDPNGRKFDIILHPVTAEFFRTSAR